jgi:hypothetical protein
METNQQATELNTTSWFEGQRASGPNYGWVTLVEANTRDEAEDKLFDSYGVELPADGYRVIRRRGMNEDA